MPANLNTIAIAKTAAKISRATRMATRVQTGDGKLMATLRFDWFGLSHQRQGASASRHSGLACPPRTVRGLGFRQILHNKFYAPPDYIKPLQGRAPMRQRIPARMKLCTN